MLVFPFFARCVSETFIKVKRDRCGKKMKLLVVIGYLGVGFVCGSVAVGAQFLVMRYFTNLKTLQNDLHGLRKRTEKLSEQCSELAGRAKDDEPRRANRAGSCGPSSEQQHTGLL